MTGFVVGEGKVRRQWKLHAIKPCFVGKKRHLFLQPTLLSCLDKRTNRKFSLPLNVSEPGGVPESFGKRIAVYFQLGYLGKEKMGTKRSHFRGQQNKIRSSFFSFPIDPSDPVSIRRRWVWVRDKFTVYWGHGWESEGLVAFQARLDIKLDCEGFKTLGKG